MVPRKDGVRNGTATRQIGSSIKLISAVGMNGPAIGAGFVQAPSRGSRFSEAFAARLREESVLLGHTGCVNRLSWSPDGQWLASGSDDRAVQVWPYPYDGPLRPVRLETHHQGNIFGVSWLPETANRELVTGAMDYTVQHHVMEGPPGPTAYGAAASTAATRRVAGPAIASCVTTMYAAHKGRIKAVESAPGDPNCFWSASEDGTVRQYDKRIRTSDQHSFESKNVLIQLSAGANRSIEVKSVAVNPVRPNQMALAAGDSAIRIFDRRKLGLGQPTAGHDTPTLLTLTPPHLSPGVHQGATPHGTHVQFGNRGDKVVANFNGDHAYSFDITAEDGAAPAAVYRTMSLGPAANTQLQSSDIPTLPMRTDVYRVSSAAEEVRGAAIQARYQGRYTDALRYVSRSLRLAPAEGDLYGMRAAVMLSRGWVGDAMFAVRDCERALRLSPRCEEALITRAKALIALEQLEAAEVAVHALEVACPRYDEEELAKLWIAIEDRLTARQEARERKRQRQQSAREAYMPTDTSDEAPEASGSGGHPDGASSAPGQAPPQRQQRRQSSSATAPFDIGGGGVSAAESQQHADRRSPRRAASSQLPDSSSRSNSSNRESLSLNSSSRGDSLQQRAFLPPLSSAAALWQGPGGQRLLQHFVGHCNSMTDIKEAVFLGADDNLVACGSDDGRMFVYNAITGEVVRMIKADSDVVNCVQPHPVLPVVATSGIECVVRLWAPGDPDPNPDDILKAVEANQQRMMEGPATLRGFNPRILQALQEDPQLLQSLMQQAALGSHDGDDPEDMEGGPPGVECRVN